MLRYYYQDSFFELLQINYSSIYIENNISHY